MTRATFARACDLLLSYDAELWDSDIGDLA